MQWSFSSLISGVSIALWFNEFSSFSSFFFCSWKSYDWQDDLMDLIKWTVIFILNDFKLFTLKWSIIDFHAIMKLGFQSCLRIMLLIPNLLPTSVWAWESVYNLNNIRKFLQFFYTKIFEKNISKQFFTLLTLNPIQNQNECFAVSSTCSYYLILTFSILTHICNSLTPLVW